MNTNDHQPSLEIEAIIEFINTYNLKPYRDTYLTLYKQVDEDLMSSLIQSITNTYDYFGDTIDDKEKK